jgi:hypothetical protein
MSYEWESGIKGTETFGTEAEAHDKADVIRHNAELRDMTVNITVKNRNA